MTIGGLAAIFYTTEILSTIARGRRDHRDVMAAGLATGGTAGLFSEACLLWLAAAAGFMRCYRSRHEAHALCKPDPIWRKHPTATVTSCSAGEAWYAFSERSAWRRHWLPGTRVT